MAKLKPERTPTRRSARLDEARVKKLHEARLAAEKAHMRYMANLMGTEDVKPSKKGRLAATAKTTEDYARESAEAFSALTDLTHGKPEKQATASKKRAPAPKIEKIPVAGKKKTPAAGKKKKAAPKTKGGPLSGILANYSR